MTSDKIIISNALQIYASVADYWTKFGVRPLRKDFCQLCVFSLQCCRWGHEELVGFFYSSPHFFAPRKPGVWPHFECGKNNVLAWLSLATRSYRCCLYKWGHKLGSLSNLSSVIKIYLQLFVHSMQCSCSISLKHLIALIHIKVDRTQKYNVDISYAN